MSKSYECGGSGDFKNAAIFSFFSHFFSSLLCLKCPDGGAKYPFDGTTPTGKLKPWIDTQDHT